MASVKIKYVAVIASSLIAGGLISVTAWQALHTSEKTENSAPKKGAFLV